MPRNRTYELWVGESKVARIVTNRKEYTQVMELRKIVNSKYRNAPFEIYRVLKSKFPPPDEEDMSDHLVLPKYRNKVFEKERPPAEYSNHSPLKIASQL